MAQEKTRIWLVVILVIAVICFLITGIYALINDINNLLGYIFLGLGAGGAMAGYGVYRDEKAQKNINRK